MKKENAAVGEVVLNASPDLFLSCRRDYFATVCGLPSSYRSFYALRVGFDTCYNGEDKRNWYRLSCFDDCLAFAWDYVAWEYENRLDKNAHNRIWNDDDDLSLISDTLTDDFVSDFAYIFQQLCGMIETAIKFDRNAENVWRPVFDFETRAALVRFDFVD